MLPWIQIVDAALGVFDLVRHRRSHSMSAQPQQPAQEDRDVRLAGVVASTLREELERDRLRLQRERERVEDAERQRAELALKLELQRQAGDREIGRLRLLTGVAVAGWLGTLLLGTLAGHVMGGRVGARVVLGFGWVLLLAAIASSFIAQANVVGALEAIAGGDAGVLKRGVSSGFAGALAVWLIVCGLAFAGLALLIA